MTQLSEYVSYKADGNIGIWKSDNLPAAIEADNMKTAEQHSVETDSRY